MSKAKSAENARLPIETVTLTELMPLQEKLHEICGGRVPPHIPDVGSGFNSMAAQEFPPPDERQDPISSHISWAPSFISATTRAARVEKGWSGGVATGLSVVTDALHQQLINMGRKAKSLIDMQEIDPGVRAIVGSMYVPGKAGSPRISHEQMASMTAAFKDAPDVPIRVKTAEGEMLTLRFKNTPVGVGGESLIHTLIGLHTLAGGNISRYKITPEGEIDNMAERGFVDATGAAAVALETLARVKTELVRQLIEMKKTDKRLRDTDPEKAISQYFDINRESFKATLEKEAGNLQMTAVIAAVTHRYHKDKTKTIAGVLSLIGHELDDYPKPENADQAQRLIAAIAYGTKQHHAELRTDEPKWEKLQRSYRVNAEKLVATLKEVAKTHPDDPSAVLDHAGVKELLELAEQTATQNKNESLKHAVDVAHLGRAPDIDSIETTMRGEKSWLGRVGVDLRRRSTVVDALKQGVPTEQIGEAGVAAAARYEEGRGKPNYSELLREEIKNLPRNR